MTGANAGKAVCPVVVPQNDVDGRAGRDGAEIRPHVHSAPFRAIPPLRSFADEKKHKVKQ